MGCLYVKNSGNVAATIQRCSTLFRQQFQRCKLVVVYV